MVAPPVENDIRFTGAGGVTLVGHAVGSPHAPPVLLLHGGGQTRHAWGRTARAIAQAGFHAVALDHRGHGDSGWPDDGDYAMATFAEDVRLVAAALGRPPVAIGASIGGLASLLAEGEHAGTLAGLVLVDAGPRLEQDGVRKVLAFMSTGLDGFASLEEAAEAIAAYLPHRRKRSDLGGLAKNLRQGADGRWRWHWDPRFVRRTGPDPTYSRERFVAATRLLRCPVLLVRGRMSDVLTEEAAREFLDMVPHARFVDVAGAAHMVAGDDNDAFSVGVVDFLRDLPGDTPAAPAQDRSAF
jgi:pimeloyl-ACP methyl ester carboxylesterase